MDPLILSLEIQHNVSPKKKKNQKDISETAREIGEGLEKISSRQENLTSLSCVEDPLMLASVSIVVTRGSRASFSNFKLLTLIS